MSHQYMPIVRSAVAARKRHDGIYDIRCGTCNHLLLRVEKISGTISIEIKCQSCKRLCYGEVAGQVPSADAERMFVVTS